MNGFVKFALGIAGLPPAVIADIDKAIPGVARLAEAAKQIEPYLEQAHPHIEAITPHLEALLPIFEKVMPILKAEYPDIVALLPTAKEIIAFVEDKKQAAAHAPLVNNHKSDGG